MTQRLEGVPDAPILKLQNNRGVSTVVIQCPYCPRKHTHGAELGHRVQHCAIPVPGSGYNITDPRGLLGGTPTAVEPPAGTWVWFPSLTAHFIRGSAGPLCRPLKSWRGHVAKSVAHLEGVGWSYRCRWCMKALGISPTQLCAGCSVQHHGEAGWLVGHAIGKGYGHRLTTAGEAIPTEGTEASDVFCPSCAVKCCASILARLTGGAR